MSRLVAVFLPPCARFAPFGPLALWCALISQSAVGLPAQAVADGHASNLRSLPPTASAVAILDQGPLQGIAWFDGQDLVFEETGQSPRPVLHLPSPRFGAFTLPVGVGHVLFGDSSLDELWLVPLAASGVPQLLTTVRFPYDAVRLGTGRVLVSAKTGGFPASANDLIAVDLATGAATPIGFVPGASGPLAIDRDGALLYATAPLAFPPPPGSVQILRWTALQWAQALAGGPPLTHVNAAVVAAGIDNAAYLALDGDGDLLFVDFSAGVYELDDFGATPGAANLLVDYAGTGLYPSSCCFLAESPSSQFEPFALSGGGRLFVQETDFGAQNRLREVSARAGDLAVAPMGPSGVPVGAFAVTLDHATRNGLALFAIGLVATGVTMPLQFPGFEQVARWDVGLVYPLVTELVPTDALGQATLMLNNPGLPGGLLVHAQAAFAATAPNRLGATAVRAVQLAP